MGNLGKRIKGIKRKKDSLLVTPAVEQFLAHNSEGVIWDQHAYDLFKWLTKRTFGGNSKRSGRFGASGRGMCHRRQIFGYLGMPHTVLMSPETAILFSDGKWRHIRWQMLLIQSGALDLVEVPYKYPELRLSGSMDGFNSQGTVFGFELKGDRIRTRGFDEDIPEKHNLQIHSMMLGKDIDLFSYLIEAKDTQQYREHVIHRDEKVIKQVVEELEVLNEYVEARQLPPILEECKAKTGAYRGCPFAGRCLRQQGWNSEGEWDDDD